ncbi:MAG: hydrogenase expression/formation protein HypE [Clostridiales Family XIII bacterium]|jgi:hydrogenase expression/formation protein HypE|nr:hydrogenase expression/formation protein HypE [Clostridiales Family XIII bacterium]
MELTGTITMAHGSGGEDSSILMRHIFGKRFANPTLDRLEDAAVLPPHNGQFSFVPSPLVVSTDSFVVTPMEFAGGDIGKLAVCGTVNDVLMMGGVPTYLTCGFILEEGLGLATIDRVAASMARAAKAAGVTIVAGDTKVIGRGGADAATGAGMFINTTGIGFLRESIASGEASAPGATGARAGDAVLVSGTLGDHHACILSARLGIENGITSDCAALNDVAGALYETGLGVHVHAMRDVTRGGLATVMNEIAEASVVTIELDENSIPVTGEVRAFCGIMGLDPLYMGNEGKMIAIVRGEDAEHALATMRRTEHGKGARIIGRVVGQGESAVIVKTRIGGTRKVSALRDEGLPRIC